jgi:TolB-like protein/Tfp pilus assembly protein PilF
MKRCPQCNRMEADDTLAFCRADGAALVRDSSAPSADAGTLRLSSSPAGEAGTSILPHTTDAATSRSTGPATVLPEQVAPRTTGRLTQTKRRTTRFAVAALVAGVIVLAIVIGGYFYSTRSGGTAITSIAVMPFVNEGGNPDVEYLSDGMTETLIRGLSQLPGLNVKARSSVFRYKGREIDPKRIASELNVQAVLNGRVAQRGEQLTLSLELIDARTENVIWADRYDRNSSDLLSLQNEIARDVSSKLKTKLSGADERRLAKTYTNDPEAYRLYLQGRFYWNKRAGREFAKSERYFRQAVEKDPNFALGYVGLADFYGDRERDKAKENVNRALALDDGLAEAHGTLGYQYMLDYDWAASERHMKRALELDPKNLELHRWDGQRLMMLGRYDEALAAYRRALEIDPTSSPVHFIYGACLVASGQLDEGIEYLENAAKSDPSFVWTHSHLSFAYRLKGNYARMAEERAVAQELLGRPDNAKLTRDSFAKGGRDGYLREMIRQGLEENPDGISGGMREASAHALLGDHEKALATLESAAKRGEFWLFQIKYDPAYEPLRGDPRFQSLVRKFDPPQ